MEEEVSELIAMLVLIVVMVCSVSFSAGSGGKLSRIASVLLIVESSIDVRKN